jgi:hypothetical protein
LKYAAANSGEDMAYIEEDSVADPESVEFIAHLKRLQNWMQSLASHIKAEDQIRGSKQITKEEVEEDKSNRERHWCASLNPIDSFSQFVKVLHYLFFIFFLLTMVPNFQ